MSWGIFPDPIDWIWDHASDAVAGVASGGFGLVISGFEQWTLDAALWAVGAVFGFFVDATDPDVQAAWFSRGDGPYAMTAGIGLSLLVLFVLFGIVEGVVAGDGGGMLRRFAVDLPVSVLSMVSLVAVTQVAIHLTDALSNEVLIHFQTDVEAFTNRAVAVQAAATGGTQTSFIVVVLALVTAVAGLVLVAELVVRSALIYIVVALAPLAFATRLWPSTKSVSRKLIELLAALILSKLVIAVALSIAAAGLARGSTGTEETPIRPPESSDAPSDDASATEVVGILMTAAATFGIAAFSPLLVSRLLPLTEAAVVAHGVKGGPVRAGQQGMMMANTAQMVSGRRMHQLASRSAPASASTTAAGAATTSAAAATGGGALVATAASRSIRSGAAFGARAVLQDDGPSHDGANSRTSSRPTRGRPQDHG